MTTKIRKLTDKIRFTQLQRVKIFMHLATYIHTTRVFLGDTLPLYRNNHGPLGNRLPFKESATAIKVLPLCKFENLNLIAPLKKNLICMYVATHVRMYVYVATRRFCKD